MPKQCKSDSFAENVKLEANNGFPFHLSAINVCMIGTLQNDVKIKLVYFKKNEEI